MQDPERVQTLNNETLTFSQQIIARAEQKRLEQKLEQEVRITKVDYYSDLGLFGTNDHRAHWFLMSNN
jgi:hypothetical protein